MFILNKENLEKLVLKNDIHQTISVLSAIENQLSESDETKAHQVFQYVINVAVKNSCLRPLQALVAYYENNDESFQQFQDLAAQQISVHHNFDIIEKCLISKITSVNSLLKAASEENDIEMLNFILNHDYIAVLTKEQKNLSLNIYLSNDIDTISHVEALINTSHKEFDQEELKQLINHCFITQSAESLKYLETQHNFNIKEFMKDNIGVTQLTNLTFSLAFATSVNTFYLEKEEKQSNFIEYLLSRQADKNLVFSLYFKGLMNEENSMEIFKNVYDSLEKKGLVNEEELKEIVSDKKLQACLDYKNALNEKHQLEENIELSHGNKPAMKL